MFAEFEIRQLELGAARKILGEAIGRRPKPKVFDYYIKLELQLGNVDRYDDDDDVFTIRCRKIFEKYLLTAPENCKAWTSYADLERLVGEIERSRAIYELAVKQPVLDMPEVVWKNYIDFETTLKEYDRARTLYRRLLDRSKHVKVWISFASFEYDLPGDENVELARGVYREADDYFRQMGPGSNNAEEVCMSMSMSMMSCVACHVVGELVRFRVQAW